MHTSKSSIHPETPNIVLKSIFQRYDADHDGLLNSFEFGNALEDLGINDETEQRALFALADSNNSKTVHLDDFIKLIKSNDFELILSSPEDYEFVIETYKAFQKYDQNADGQITWDEFYFYLTKHGYSHQYISQYWYYMDVEQKLTVSFEGFWKGFKLQANAMKQYELQQAVNKQIEETHSKEDIKKHGMHSKVLNRASLIESHSWSHQDKNNIFEYMKKQLKPTKVHKSEHAVPLGRVLDSDEEDISHNITITDALRICCNLKESKPSRLPDIIAMTQSPLHAILPSFTLMKPKEPEHALHIHSMNLLSPSFPEISLSDYTSPSVTPNYSMSSTPNYSLISTPNYSLILTPNYSNDLRTKGLTRFPSISSPTPFSPEDSHQSFPSVEIQNHDGVDDVARETRKRMHKKKRRKKRKRRKKLRLMKAESEQCRVDRSSNIKPRKISKYLKKHKMCQSVSIDI